MPRTPGVFTDCPPGPAPALVQPPPDFQLAQRLVQRTTDAITGKCKAAVKMYYSSLLQLAAGETTEENLPPDFQQAIALLRKSPAQLQGDLAEARRIVGAKAWLARYDPAKNKAELTAAATRIAEFDEQLRREIARIRSAAAPFHERVGELQRAQFSLATNAAQARGWDHWLEGRFEPAPEILDRLRNSL